MKKTNFFKLLLVGAAALTLGFTGCTKYVEDTEFQELCDKVTALEQTVGDLQNQINALGGWVTDVKKKSDAEPNILVVTWEDGRTQEIELPEQSTFNPDDFAGADHNHDGVYALIDHNHDGVYAPINHNHDDLYNKVEIVNGNWYINGDDTGYPAIAPAPKIVFDEENQQMYWVFPVMGEDGEIVWEPGDQAISVSYAVNTGTEDLPEWTLWMPTADSEGLLVPIKLPNGIEIGKIDILGWLKGKGEPAEPININGEVDRNNGKNFAINYHYIDAFVMDTRTRLFSSSIDAFESMNGLFSALDGENGSKVTYGKDKNWKASTEVVIKNVLTTTAAERKGLLVQVHPAFYDLKAEDVELLLQNSRDGVLPLKIGTPELITGMLTTRAAESSGVWFIPVTYYAGSNYTYDNEAKYTDLYHGTSTNENAAVSLVTGQYRSEYTRFPFITREVTSFEAAVKSLQPGGITPNLGNSNAAELLVYASYKVVEGVEYTLDFNETRLDPEDGRGNTTDAVVDYYIEVKENNNFVKEQFGIVITNDLNKKASFKITSLPDELTLAYFVLTVYKLGVDGVIYREDIIIYPTRANAGDVIREGVYELNDENTRINTNAYLSWREYSTLDKMFAAEGVNASRWQSSQYGARSWKLVSMSIDKKAVDGKTYEDPQANKAKLTLAQWVKMYTDAGGKFGFTDNVKPADATVTSTGTISGGVLGGSTASLYNVRQFFMEPAYARADGVTPMFDLFKEYEFMFEFYENDGNVISYAIVRFTPTIPGFAQWFEKELFYWDTNDQATAKVLSAYYREPGSHWTVPTPSYFYSNGSTFGGPFGTDVSATFHNVYATQALQVTHKPTMPYDGGYLKFGQSADGDKKWLNSHTRLDFIRNDKNEVIQKLNDKTVDNYLAVGPVNTNPMDFSATKSTIVSLTGQTPTPPTAADWGYKSAIDMRIIPGLYLNVYNYLAYAEFAEEIKAAEFVMNIMSALEEGTIAGTDENGEINIVLGAGGDTFEIDEDNFTAANYNGRSYKLFKVNGRYDYNYVYSVQFYMTDKVGTDYIFVDRDGDRVNDGQGNGVTVTTELAETKAGEGDACVRIRATNAAQTFETEIGVRVIDRFGRKKEQPVKVNITRN